MTVLLLIVMNLACQFPSLYIASFWGFSDMVTALLEKGADINHSNAGTLWTPLHAATFQEHGKVYIRTYPEGHTPWYILIFAIYNYLLHA